MSIKRLFTLTAALCAVAAIFASSASADKLIWFDGGSSPALNYTTLDGGSSGPVDIGPASLNNPSGVTFDSATQTFYWADGNTIGWSKADGSASGQLNTSGATVSNIQGVIVDPDNDRIYWANSSGTVPIAYANLDGSGGADLAVSGADILQPIGLTIDAATNQVYWANRSDISYAALDGLGGGILDVGGAPTFNAITPVIDGSKVYWSSGNTIGYTNADGSGDAGSFSISNAPRGMAIDALTGIIYGASTSTNSLFTVADDGTGLASVPTGTLTPAFPVYPILIKTPASDVAPQLSGKDTVGSQLRCTNGTWAADQLGSYVYQQPGSYTYTWKLDNQTVATGSSDTYIAGDAGAWTCAVTASNYSGSTTVAASDTIKVSTASVSPVAPTPPTTTRQQPSPVPPKTWPVPLQISNLRVTPSHFTVAHKATLLTLAKISSGTKIRFTTSAPGKIKFWIKHTPHRKPLRSLAHGFTRTVAAGNGSVGFTGVFPGGKIYRPGNYVLYAQIIDPTTGAVGNTTEAGFTILPRR